MEAEKKMLKKNKKYHKKARKAANLDFNQLLNLAHEQAQKPSHSSGECLLIVLLYESYLVLL